MLKPFSTNLTGKISLAAAFRLIFLVAIVFLTSCQPPSPQPLATTTSAPDEATPPSSPAAPTILPTATPTPGSVILWAPEGADPDQKQEMQTALASLTQQAGFYLEVKASVDKTDLLESTKLVVVLPPAEGVLELASAASNVQFLAIGIPELKPAGNLSRIGFSEDSPTRRAFLAGYTAALITPDWRVALIYPSDPGEEGSIQQSFQNGITFYCGLCRPAYPPYYTYPIIVELPSGASEAEIQTEVDKLTGFAVETVYLAAEVPQPILAQQLAAAGIHIIGNTPVVSESQAAWIASIRDGLTLEEAVLQLWPEILAGKGGGDLQLSMSLEDINPDLFSPGRQRLAEELLNDLRDDRVQP